MFTGANEKIFNFYRQLIKCICILMMPLYFKHNAIGTGYWYCTVYFEIRFLIEHRVHIQYFINRDTQRHSVAGTTINGNFWKCKLSFIFKKLIFMLSRDIHKFNPRIQGWTKEFKWLICATIAENNFLLCYIYIYIHILFHRG